MSNHIQQILNSGLSLSVVDGRLSVKGDSVLVERFRHLLKQYRDEIIIQLQADSATERQGGMFAPASRKVNAAQALQCSYDGKKLLEDAVILINKLQTDRPEQVGELIKAFNTVEAAEQGGSQDNFNYALKEIETIITSFAAPDTG